MSRVIKRSAVEATKTGRPARAETPLPRRIPPRLCQLVSVPPSAPGWLHEIRLDGFRMSARTEREHVQLLTRTGLDWSGKYPETLAALSKLSAQAAYLDG